MPSPRRGSFNSDGDDLDPISLAVSKSNIAQLLKAARRETSNVTLAEPSRPFTPMDRSLFRHNDINARPSSSYGGFQQRFGGMGGWSRIGDSAIPEEEEARFTTNRVDVMRFDDVGDCVEEKHYSYGDAPEKSPMDGPIGSGPTTGFSVSSSSGATDRKTSSRKGRRSNEDAEFKASSSLGEMRGTSSLGEMKAASSLGEMKSSSSVDNPVASIRIKKQKKTRISAVDRPSSGRRSSEKKGTPLEAPSGTPVDALSASPVEVAPSVESTPPASSPADSKDSCNEILTPVMTDSDSKPLSTNLGEQVVESLQQFIRFHNSGNTDGFDRENSVLRKIASQIRQVIIQDPTSPVLAKILRSLLEALDCIDIENHPDCVLQFCRLAMDLLRYSQVVAGVPEYAIHEAYLTLCKILFKCSKETANDSLFEDEQIVEPLLRLLRETIQFSVNMTSASDESEAEMQSNDKQWLSQKTIKVVNDIRIFLIGCLKNISTISTANIESLIRNGAVAVITNVLNLMDELEAQKQKQSIEQVWVQAVALLRNIACGCVPASSGEKYHPDETVTLMLKDFKKVDIVDVLTRLAATTMEDVLTVNSKELLVNISRVLSKLSLFECILSEKMVPNEAFVRQALRMLELDKTYESEENGPCHSNLLSDDEGNTASSSTSGNPVSSSSGNTTSSSSRSGAKIGSSETKLRKRYTATLTLRMSFVLGNMCANCERIRIQLMLDQEGILILPPLVEKYWNLNRQALMAKDAMENKSTEEILTKLVRLVANVSVDASVGARCAALPSIVDPLLDMLGCKKIQDAEELVLNVVAAITNLLYYDSSTNLFFLSDNKHLLCRVFRPLLLESYNLECSIETARALGNLSRHKDTRLMMRDLRLDEIVVIFLDLESRDLLYYLCGVLVNLAADPDCSMRLVLECGNLVDRLVELFTSTEGRPDLSLVLLKVLINLALTRSNIPANSAMSNGEEKSTAAPLFVVLEEQSLKRLRTKCSELGDSELTTKDLRSLSASFLQTLPITLELGSSVMSSQPRGQQQIKKPNENEGTEDEAATKQVSTAAATKPPTPDDAIETASATSTTATGTLARDSAPPSAMDGVYSAISSVYQGGGTTTGSSTVEQTSSGSSTPCATSSPESETFPENRITTIPRIPKPNVSNMSGIVEQPQSKQYTSPKKRLAQKYLTNSSSSVDESADAIFACHVSNCGRKFTCEKQLHAHVARRHPNL